MSRPQATDFCITCGDDRSYIVKSNKAENEVRGVRFTYTELTAYCAICGSELYVPEINDANVQAQEDAYREASGLIKVAELTKIFEKYNIGAGPLAKIMGYGDITINRYVNGNLPSKKHSDELLEVLSSHRKMESMLESNKEKLAPIAYQKCREAIDKLNFLYGDKRVDIVARYILNKSHNDITPMALQKLLYYAQSFFYALFGEELFSDCCQAWVHGPVYPDVYYKYRNFGFDPIEKPLQYLNDDLHILSEKEVFFLNSIISAFGCYSGSTLRNFTHTEYPWLETRSGLKADERCFTEISKKAINDFFKDVIRKYDITSPSDIKKYSLAMYKSTMI